MARLGRSQHFKPLIIRKPRSAFLQLVSLTETITIVNPAITKSISRALSETVTLVDHLGKTISRAFSEVVALTDLVAPTLTKNFLETIILADRILRSIFLNEAITVVDGVFKGASKSLVDTLSISSSMIKALTRSLTESVTVTDLAVTLFKPIRGLIRGIAKRTGTLLGVVSESKVQRGKSTSTNTKRGSSL